MTTTNTTSTTNEIEQEASRRRTFAIISHPDAGKTTLTEALLLLGGAIREAGAVKAKKSRRTATSDWMDIEKQRGISVTSTVLQFHYRDLCVNILDTPGHQDFSDDTYRTLTAADSVVMLIDAAKGVEAQTIKLFQVCRLRQIPIYTFINKMDREGRDPLDLLKELEDVLEIQSYPMNWPVGMGNEFRGVYHRHQQAFEPFDKQQAKKHQEKNGLVAERPKLIEAGVEDPKLAEHLGEEQASQLAEDVGLLDVAGEPFDEARIRRGELTPVFFGSALAQFGVHSFLDEFVKMAPGPAPRKTEDGDTVAPDAPFAGFVFKIQANMNPAHRDRVAFLRVCSGKFERGMGVTHVQSGKKLNLTQSQQFFAQDRTTVEEAYPGDIIGIHDTGLLEIGDTLCDGSPFRFEALPQFSPEHFARVHVKDTLKYKAFHKGLLQLSQEGAIQLFRMANRTGDLLLGVVGQLQFDVFEYRMKLEYGVEAELTHLPYRYARWMSGTNGEGLDYDRSSCVLVRDTHERLVMLFANDYSMRWVTEKNPQVRLSVTSYESQSLQM